MGVIETQSGAEQLSAQDIDSRAREVETLLYELSQKVGQTIPMRGEAMRRFYADTPVEHMTTLFGSHFMEDYADDPRAVGLSGPMTIIYAAPEVGVVVQKAGEFGLPILLPETIEFTDEGWESAAVETSVA